MPRKPRLTDEEREARKKASRERYRQRYPERARASQAAYVERNKDNPEYQARYVANYMRAAHSETRRLYRQKYRDRKRELDRIRKAAKRARLIELGLIVVCEKVVKPPKVPKLRRPPAPSPRSAEARQAELMRIDIYAAARAAMPKGLPPFVRDDVVADIVLAHLEGALPLAEVSARAKEFVTAHYRTFDQWKTVSLDAPMPGTDRRYIDSLAEVLA